MSDPRPCKGDGFVPASTKLDSLNCFNCKAYTLNRGKCAGARGYDHAQAAGVRLEGQPCES